MGSYYQRFKARIGIVCDTILFESLSAAAEFVYLPRAEWRGRLDGLDLVLVASVWRGLCNEDWLGVGRVGDPIRAELLDLIAEARRRGIPTVFYSKEDPPNYRVFLDFAKACDHVFTSAEEMEPRYREDCGHDRVATLTFCVNPEHDNPIGCMRGPRHAGAVFSGSWMVKYPRRCHDLQVLLSGVRKSGAGLMIVNRNSYRPDHPKYLFPAEFSRFIESARPHAELKALHQTFAWSLNVNSVMESRTMFAARCYELLAAGCPVISNFSVGVLELLPEVVLANTAGFVRRFIRKATPGSILVRRAAGIRRAFDGNTCFERVARVLAAIGRSDAVPQRSVAVVVAEKTARLQEMFDRQTFASRRLFTTAEFTSEAAEGFDYVADWRADEEYGPYYLQDLIDVFKYTDADYATDVGPAYEYTEVRTSGRMLIRRGVEPQRGFSVPRSATLAETARVIASGHEVLALPEWHPSSQMPTVWVRALRRFREFGLFHALRRILFRR